MTTTQHRSANADAKLERLRAQLREIGSAAVAFSSGVDSTFLLRVAHEELGDRVVAVTARSRYFPKRELDEAEAFCRSEGVRHGIVDSEALDIPGFAENPPDRCYHCKKSLFGKLIAFAQANGLNAVLEGSNVDDDGDYRPGRRAIREFGRDGARPSHGLTQLRVRSHDDVARIEVPPKAIARIAVRAGEVAAALKGFGFAYVALDLQGYRTGSMNETLMTARSPSVTAMHSEERGCRESGGARGIVV